MFLYDCVGGGTSRGDIISHPANKQRDDIKYSPMTVEPAVRFFAKELSVFTVQTQTLLAL